MQPDEVCATNSCVSLLSDPSRSLLASRALMAVGAMADRMVTQATASRVVRVVGWPGARAVVAGMADIPSAGTAAVGVATSVTADVPTVDGIVGGGPARTSIRDTSRLCLPTLGTSIPTEMMTSSPRTWIQAGAPPRNTFAVLASDTIA